MENLSTHQIDSLKAGIVAASSFCLAYGFALLLEGLMPELMAAEANGWLRWGVAWASGFLFGVTYRYIIRQESNPHLKGGAILAFAIVRGLAPADFAPESSIIANLEILTVFGVESLFCFSAAFLALDIALNRGWVKPMQ